MINSAIITINGFTISGSQITITAGAMVSVALLNVATVSSWSFSCTSNNDPTNTDLINHSIVINETNFTTSFIIPLNISGEAFQFTSSVINTDNSSDSYIFDVYIPSAALPNNPNFNPVIPPSPCSPNINNSLQLGGDLVGFLPNPRVVGLQYNPVEQQSLGANQDGYVLTWIGNEWQASTLPLPSISGNNIGVPNIASLRTVIATSANTIGILSGYHSVNDGGGGTFYWDTSSHTGDNGGTIIVPTGSTTGRWLRIYDGQVNVLWFGAYGNGTNDDTLAIQSALNFVQIAGDILFFPPGTFKITAPTNDVALYIKQECMLQGSGAESTILLIGGPGTGILIEPYTPYNAAYTEISDMSLQGGSIAQGVGTLPRDLLVCHAGNCTFQNMYLVYPQRFGILAESGNITGDASGGLLGISKAPIITPDGYYVSCDETIIENVNTVYCPNPRGQVATTTADYVQPAFNSTVTISVSSTAALDICPYVVIGADPDPGGNLYSVSSVNSSTSITIKNLAPITAAAAGITIASGTRIQIGASIYIHGSDAQIIRLSEVSTNLANIGMVDHSLGGITYLNCYGQTSSMDFIAASSGPGLYLKCGSESVNSVCINGGTTPLFIGGALPAGLNAQNQNNTLIGYACVDSNLSNLVFSQTDSQGVATYGMEIPNAEFKAPMLLSRNVSGSNSLSFFSYNFNPGSNFPYQLGSFMWKHLLNGVSDVDIGGGPFGWTEPQSALGTQLALLPNPTANTQRHWTWRQAVSLTSGSNLIYLNGGATNAGAVPFLDPALYVYTTSGPTGTNVWPTAQRSLKLSLEYASATDLTTASASSGVYVVGYSFVEIGTGPPTTWNALASVNNGCGSTVSATLIWNFDITVPNYAAGSGNIG